MKISKLLAVAALVLTSCGDNIKPDVPGGRQDSGPIADAYCSDCPAAPALGAQIDRMGRPAINTVLNHGFDATSAAPTAKTAYNEDASKANWATNVDEFKIALGVLDALDTGMCGNGKCEATETNSSCAIDCPTANQTGAGNGCGNQVLYNGGQAGIANVDSYKTLASLLANDELYVDTDKPTCQYYLAVEFAVATTIPNMTCGGRAPAYDVIDFTYSALAAGIAGFSTDGNYTPEVKDNVDPHIDYLASFPYLGNPH